MTTKEKLLQEKIKRLEKENLELQKKLKKNNSKPHTTLIGEIRNEKEYDFLYPYFSKRDNGWIRSSTATGLEIRNLAMSTVQKPDENQEFQVRKIKELNEEEFQLALDCADELILVAAKYKKKYLESIGRMDIIEIFGMEGKFTTNGDMIRRGRNEDLASMILCPSFGEGYCEKASDENCYLCKMAWLEGQEFADDATNDKSDEV